MRAINFIIFLCFFLLCGGHHSIASNSNTNISYAPSQSFFKNRQVKITNQSNNLILIDESDIDLEEEYTNDNDVNNANDTKVIFTNPHLNKWYSLFCIQSIVDQNFKFLNTELFLFDRSTPIYISQRVLRI